MRFLGQCVRRLAVLCATVGLSACASGIPLGVLDPVALPAGATTETMFVATTRARPKVEFARMFSGERSRTVDHARITVSIPPNHQAGEVEWPRSAPGDPRTTFVTADRDYMVDKTFIANIRTELAKRKPADRNVLIFIHGYNTKFEEAVFRFAQIIHDSDFKGVPVLFTWPSRGALLDYPYDRESAVFSRDDLENTMTAIAKETGVKKMDVLAHSMGNFLFVETLRQATIRGNGNFNGKLGQIMLAAPDIDIDVFRRQMSVITKLKPPITIFVSSDDKALKFSTFVWGSQTRAGATIISDPKVLDQLAALNITIFDLSDLKTSDSLGHGKFAASPDVVQLIGRRLAADGGIQQRGPGLGEGIVALGSSLGTTVGKTVGAAVAVPEAVLTGKATALPIGSAEEE